jgi:hypothetical protein
MDLCVVSFKGRGENLYEFVCVEDSPEGGEKRKLILTG